MSRKIEKKVKSNINKKSNKNSTDKSKTKKVKTKKKIGFTILKVFIFTMIAVCIIGGGVAFGILTSIINETELIDIETLNTEKLTSFVYDSEGNQIGAFYDEENRVSLEYEDISPYIIDAAISIEDERFEEHGGVDIQRTVAATISYVLSGGDSDFGGSTITQQLVKQKTQDNEQDWQRKVREWYRAVTIESQLEKEDILTLYLNTVYLGDGQYGVEMASRNYFAKSASEVNIAEAAVLAALIQLPGATNPYGTEEQKAALLERQQLVLSQMLKLGKITQEEYDEAASYELVFEKGDTAISDDVQSYFVDAVFEQVVEDLMEEKGIEKGVAQQMIYTGGLKIYTTQDSDIQKIVDEEYDNDAIFYTDSSGDFMQSSMVIMDQSTGYVVALMGGAGEKEGALSLNRATSTTRQPGSTMKPLGAYGPAMELGYIGLATGLDDSQLTIGDWTPVNYYNYYNGYVTVREAIKYSMNIPAIRANLMVGTEYAYNFAKNAGLTSLVEADKNSASLSLGGLTYGVTVLELTNAYATIANGGVYTEPLLYTKVTDSSGNIVLENEIETKTVMSDTTAYMLTDAMIDVTSTSGGTANGYIQLDGMPNAGKTGNTNDDKDQWFVGYTPYYTCAVWNGYDDPKVIGRSYPYASITLYNNVMSRIHEDLEIIDFEEPDDIVYASVCQDSGLVATEACKCDPRGDRTITDMFAAGTVPTETCDVHKMATVCADTLLLATEYCENTIEMSFITRDYTPEVKPSDWIYMLPTEECEVHDESTVEPEEDDVVDDDDELDDDESEDDESDDNVDIY